MTARRISMLLCAAAALLLASCAAQSKPEQTAALAGAPRAGRPLIVCMGDSITAGYGVYSDDEMYSAYLQELLGERARVIARGTSGETLHEASVYASPALNAGADTVLLQFGTNDASPALFRADAFRASVETLLDTHIEALGAEHVIFLLPPCIYPSDGDLTSFGMSDEKLTQVRTILTEVCAEKGVKVVDLYAATADHPEWFPDGVHPDAEGNKAIAEAIFEAVFAE